MRKPSAVWDMLWHHISRLCNIFFHCVDRVNLSNGIQPLTAYFVCPSSSSKRLLQTNDIHKNNFKKILLFLLDFEWIKNMKLDCKCCVLFFFFYSCLLLFLFLFLIYFWLFKVCVPGKFMKVARSLAIH